MTQEQWLPGLVVVGTDGSETSVRAAQLAASLARHHEARLHVVTVVRPPEGWWGVVGSPPSAESMAAALSKAQRQVLDQTVESLDLDGLQWEVVEEIGDPAGRLVEYCREQGADVLVVGRRGAGILERVVVGSVADRVVHTSDCPVIVVP